MALASAVSFSDIIGRMIVGVSRFFKIILKSDQKKLQTDHKIVEYSVFVWNKDMKIIQ